MIISEDPPLILFSMEKTGTSSMDYALSDFFNESDYRKRLLRTSRSRFYLQPKRRKRLLSVPWNDQPELKHKSPAWLRRNAEKLLGDHSLENYYKVCFIRNPLDRLLSVYTFHTTKVKHLYPEASAAGTFKNWLLMGGTGSARKSMKKFLCGDGTVPMVDFVGRYENLDEDWLHIVQKLGLQSVSLPTHEHTRTEHQKWTEVWTDELLDLFLSNPRWKEDYRYFGYDKSLG